MATAVQEMFLDVEALAKLMGCSSRHIHNLDASGRIPACHRFGRCKRWVAEEIAEWSSAGCPTREAWESLKAANASAV